MRTVMLPRSAPTLIARAIYGVLSRREALVSKLSVRDNFARWRAQYERQLLTMATLADAVPTPWLARTLPATRQRPSPRLWRSPGDGRPPAP
jgi:hypothetical protein